ncbi:MAG: hypothetical protein KDA75_07405, partial [Planctomycetaceae bacterium]|nr:hypothetical protein [Planctomycetaceae bacterium]
NVYHVVTGSNLGPATLLDGFQIEHGVANSVKEGGGLRLTNASPVVRNCLFTLNWGERRGGAVDSVDGSPRFEDSTFVNNFTVQRGAISSRGKRDGTSTPLLFLRCMIRDNRSQPAGGGFCIDSGRNVVAINCTLMNNSHSFWEPGKDVQYGGGAVNVIGSAFTAINCLFVNNRADGYGSAVHSMSGSVQLSNCTIYGGSAKRGSEPAVFATGKVRVRVQNSIIWPDDARDVFEMKDGATLDISHCCVRGAKDLPDVTPLGPRIDGAANGDFRLGEQSKCIDAGKAEYLPPDQFDIDGDGNTSEPLPLDLNGKPRVAGKGVDFGALEYQP